MEEKKIIYNKKNWQQLSFTKPEQTFNWGPPDVKDKTIIEVIQDNPSYIKWCLKNVKKFKLGVKIQKIWDEIK